MARYSSDQSLTVSFWVKMNPDLKEKKKKPLNSRLYKSHSPATDMNLGCGSNKANKAEDEESSVAVMIAGIQEAFLHLHCSLRLPVCLSFFI